MNKLPNTHIAISWSSYLNALFAVSAWGASFTATKIALTEVSPVTVVWLRFAIGIAVIGVLVVYRGEFALPAHSEMPMFFLLGALGITFHQWLQSNGLVTSTATTTGWIVATGPVFIAALGWLILREKLRWLQVVGIILAAVGVILVVSKGEFTSLLSGRFGAPGDVLILITAPNWALFSILSRSALQRHPAGRMMFFVMLVGWLLTSIQFFNTRGIFEIQGLSAAGWLSVVFLGVFATGLAYIAWYDALKMLPASQVGVFLYIQPVVTMWIAWWLLAERITIASVFGGGIILFGVWLVNRKGR